jgi:hypothetical protein
MKKTARNAVASNMASVYHKFTPSLMPAGTLKKDGRLLTGMRVKRGLDCGAENDFIKWKVTMHGSGSHCSRASLSSGHLARAKLPKQKGTLAGARVRRGSLRLLGRLAACCDRL